MNRLDALIGERGGVEREIVHLPPHEPRRPDRPGEIERRRGGQRGTVGVRRTSQHLEGEGLQRVPGQHGHRLSKSDVDTGAPPALRVVIHAGQVVVDERIRVDQFDRRRRRKGLLRRSPHRFRRCHRQQRPEPLAARKNEVPHGAVERLGRLVRGRETTLEKGLRERRPLGPVSPQIHDLALFFRFGVEGRNLPANSVPGQYLDSLFHGIELFRAFPGQANPVFENRERLLELEITLPQAFDHGLEAFESLLETRLLGGLLPLFRRLGHNSPMLPTRPFERQRGDRVHATDS